MGLHCIVKGVTFIMKKSKKIFGNVLKAICIFQYIATCIHCVLICYVNSFTTYYVVKYFGKLSSYRSQSWYFAFRDEGAFYYWVSSFFGIIAALILAAFLFAKKEKLNALILAVSSLLHIVVSFAAFDKPFDFDLFAWWVCIVLAIASIAFMLYSVLPRKNSPGIMKRRVKVQA